MPSLTSPRSNSATADVHSAPTSKRVQLSSMTMGQHVRLLARGAHPRCPVEVYPIIAICMLPITYAAIRFYQAKDMTDISFYRSRHEIPWKDISPDDGRVRTSVYARGDGVEARKYSYPKPKSFFQRKFEPDVYEPTA